MKACTGDIHDALSAWIDGELDGAEAARVAAHADACAGCREAVETYRAMGAVLRRRAAAEQEPGIELAARSRLVGRSRVRTWSAVAACVAVAAGLVFALERPSALPRTLTADLVLLHLKALSRARPCEFPSADRAAVGAWLAEQVGHPIDVPDLPGVTLLGARRCDLSGGHAVAILYRSGDHALTVFVPVAGSPAAEASASYARGGLRCEAGALSERICVRSGPSRCALAVGDAPEELLASALEQVASR
jgi:anti-sigma factor RsiW